ncbi:MAG: Mth938-like domain-containing protein [Rickettsiales bacterium]
MEITPVLESAAQLIEAYGNGGFTIAGKRYDGAVMVFAEHTELLEVTLVENLTVKNLEALTTSVPKVEFLLVGTGKLFVPIPSHLKQFLRQHQISSDAMDTGAACRTFNILLAEARRVAAILFPVV